MTQTELAITELMTVAVAQKFPNATVGEIAILRGKGNEDEEPLQIPGSVRVRRNRVRRCPLLSREEMEVN